MTIDEKLDYLCEGMIEAHKRMVTLIEVIGVLAQGIEALTQSVSEKERKRIDDLEAAAIAQNQGA